MGQKLVENAKIQMRHFWVIFKHCAFGAFTTWGRDRAEQVWHLLQDIFETGLQNCNRINRQSSCRSYTLKIVLEILRRKQFQRNFFFLIVENYSRRKFCQKTPRKILEKKKIYVFKIYKKNSKIVKKIQKSWKKYSRRKICKKIPRKKNKKIKKNKKRRKIIKSWKKYSRRKICKKSRGKFCIKIPHKK